jgi:hypothetical protein
MTEQRRSGRDTDGPWQARFWATLRTLDAVFQKSGLITCLVLTTFSVAIAGYAVHTSAETVAKLDQEAEVRRSQTCETFEGAYAEQVRRLENTYGFLLLPGIRQRSPDLYDFAIRELPTLERGAKSDDDPFGPRVPAYCDDPNVGLPEPDPEVPRRPDGLRVP